jgi:hypothetical protein
MFTVKERARYNEYRQITCKRLSITENQYNWFRREAEKLHRLYEDNCNGIFESESQYLKDTEAIEGKIMVKAGGLKLYQYFQTDPRGASLYLDIKPIPENNYTQANCIY